MEDKYRTGEERRSPDHSTDTGLITRLIQSNILPYQPRANCFPLARRRLTPKVSYLSRASPSSSIHPHSPLSPTFYLISHFRHESIGTSLPQNTQKIKCLQQHEPFLDATARTLLSASVLPALATLSLIMFYRSSRMPESACPVTG